MLKDFLDKDGALYCGDKAREIIPFVKRKIDEFHKNDDPVIFLCDSHSEDDLEFKLFPKHCISGTRGSELISELSFDTKEDILVPKHRYNGFYMTILADILKQFDIKQKGIESIEVVGVCTSICVLFTIEELRNRDYNVVVYNDGVADFDLEAQEYSLKMMKKILGVKIV